MPAYTQMMYHVVFGTKYRRPTLVHDHKRSFLTQCCGIISGMKCHVYRINCMEDHIHILMTMPPTLEMSLFVKRFKTSSGNWLRDNPNFPQFDYWQEKYGAFTVGWEGKERIFQYIKNQEEHHKKETFMEEFKRLVREAGLEWDPRDEH